MYSLCQILLLFAHAYMHFAWELQYLVYALRSNCNKDAYMHEQTTTGFGKINICITRFGICIGDMKYLNEYTPFGSVSLCSGQHTSRQKEVCNSIQVGTIPTGTPNKTVCTLWSFFISDFFISLWWLWENINIITNLLWPSLS